MSAVLNVSLEEDSTWTQATLPVGSGGIGVCRAVQLAPSSLLASAAGRDDLILRIVPHQFQSASYPAVEDAGREWSRGHEQPPPPTPDNTQQKVWDKPQVQVSVKVLPETAPDPQARARLLAATTAESGAWLNAMPN